MLAPALKPGDSLGRYSLVRLLGEGGSGAVWEAWLVGPAGFQRPVALKVLLRPGEDAGALAMEARLGAMLSHPNLVATHELGVHDGRWFLAMELVEGVTVRTLATADLPARSVVEIGAQTCAALAHVHQPRHQGVGLVHGDVKPANLLVDLTGTVRLADLGIARWAGTAGVGVGTPGYVAPEQLEGRMDPRSDLFALGVTLFLLASGQRPFGRGRRALVAVHRVEERLADPAFLAPVEQRVPGLGPILARCLRLHPEQRWPDAASLATALLRLAGQLDRGRSLAELVRARRGPPRPDDVSGSATGSAPIRLPPRADGFVGRAALLGVLAERVRPGGLVVLQGPGGVGKTRLAIEAGHRMAGRLPGGAWFVDLTGVRGRVGACTAVASALGVALFRGDPVSQVGHALRARDGALLVLDGVDGSAPVLGELLAVWRDLAPELAVLCTTRVRLVGVESLEVGLLGRREALELLQARVPEARERPDLARAVVEALDGLPLALELAAAQARHRSLAEVLSDLRGQRSLDGMRASLEGSWRLLAPPERRVLAQLSVFAGGFELGAAQAVLDPDPEAPWAVEVLRTLVDHSLLQVDPQTGRFALLGVVRDFASEKLGAEASDVWARHGDWAAQLGSVEALAALRRHGGVARWHVLAAEGDNLRAACERAVARADVEVAVAAALALSRLARVRGPLGPALGALEAAAGLGPSRRSGELASERGQVLLEMGRIDEARVLLTEARTWFQQRGDVESEARTHVRLAMLDHRQGRLVEAEVAYLDALAVLRSVGSVEGEAVALSNLGLLRIELGGDAGPVLEEALELGIRVGDERTQGIVLGSLALVHRRAGHLDEAEACLTRSAQVHRAVGARRSEAIVLGNLALLAWERGDLDGAERRLRSSVRTTRQSGARHYEGIHLGNLGMLLRARGRSDEALALLTEARAVHAEVGNRLSEATVLVELGDLAGERALLERAIELAAVGQGQRIEGAARVRLAMLDRRAGDLQAALRQLDLADGLLRGVGDGAEIGQMLCGRCLALLGAGDRAGATAAVQEAEALAAARGAGADSQLGRALAEARAALGSPT